MPILDFANPLHTFDSTHLTFTATKDCYLCGSLSALNGTISIDGNVVFQNSYTSGSPAIYDNSAISPLKIKQGSTIVASNVAVYLKVYDVVN